MTPLTEIVTVGVAATTGVVVVGGVPEDGTALGGGVDAGVVVVVVGVGVVVVGGAPVAGAPEVSGGVGALATCGTNGFFVWKTSNVTSCPAPESGGTSVFTSSPL